MKRIDDERDGETVVHLPVQVRSTEYGEGEPAEARSVRCPLSGSSMSLEHCMHCQRCSGLLARPEEDFSLRCKAPAVAVESNILPGEWARRLESTPVAEVMTSKVTCVDSELDLDEVAQVFEKEHIRAAPVVDDEGVLIGMVSKSDLVRGYSHDDEEDEREEGGHFPPNCLGVIVDDIMTKDVAKLRETATVAEAARMFAARGVHHIPVVTKDEIVVGILSVVDVVRWLARLSENLPSSQSGM